MIRLTRKFKSRYNLTPIGSNKDRRVDAAIQKLGSYEDAEEQGTLYRLPCKTGDILYVLNRNQISRTIAKNELKVAHGKLYIFCDGGFSGFISSDDFGKTVFRTKEEALKKLK